jgi:hypothetical protein
MKRAIVAVLAALMLAGLITAQKLSPVPADERLYLDRELEIEPGWRLATSSDPDSDGQEILIYYDIDRVTKYATGYRAWIRHVYRAAGSESLRVSLEDFDCKRHQILIVESISYDKDGGVISQKVGTGNWLNIAPDSLGESTYNIFCRGQRDKQWMDMVVAQRYFAWGRQDEKKLNPDSAFHWYKLALNYAPENPKILAALKRMEEDPLGIDEFLRRNPQPTTSGISPEVAELFQTAQQMNKPMKKKPRRKKH